MTAAPPRRFRFRPRFAGLAVLAAVVGVIILGVSLLGELTRGATQAAALTGVFGVLLAVAYLASPAWRLVIEVSDAGVRVVRDDDVRVALAWADIERLLVDREHGTCVIDGGSVERRVLVPGPGLPAPYRIEDGAALVELLLDRVPADRQAPLRAAPPPEADDT